MIACDGKNFSPIDEIPYIQQYFCASPTLKNLLVQQLLNSFDMYFPPLSRSPLDLTAVFRHFDDRFSTLTHSLSLPCYHTKSLTEVS